MLTMLAAWPAPRSSRTAAAAGRDATRAASATSLPGDPVPDGETVTKRPSAAGSVSGVG